MSDKSAPVPDGIANHEQVVLLAQVLATDGPVEQTIPGGDACGTPL